VSKTRRWKEPEQRILEREVREDRRYRARAVSNNKPRATEKQYLRRKIEEKDYD